jgi:hypothetical protein
MSLHDDYARVTPFEIAFPDQDAVERLVREIAEEASARGVDPELPGIFVTLGAVGDFVRDLQAPDAPDEAARELGALLFHAVHFAKAGRPVHLLRTAATRYLVEGAPAGEPRPPSPAGYLQLPQHLFWMGGRDGSAPESIDGLFWVASGTGTLHVLPITGVLPERMAFRALPLPEAPLEEAPGWVDTQVREGSPDYSSALPGHDLDGLYSIETAGEVLKLLARFFSYVDAVPEAVERSEPASGAAQGGPRPSTLPYTRVKLVA